MKERATTEDEENTPLEIPVARVASGGAYSESTGEKTPIPDNVPAFREENTDVRNLASMAIHGPDAQMALPSDGGDPFEGVAAALFEAIERKKRESGGGGGGGGDGKPPGYIARHPWVARIASIIGAGGLAFVGMVYATEKRSEDNERAIEERRKSEAIHEELPMHPAADKEVRLIKARIGDIDTKVEDIQDQQNQIQDGINQLKQESIKQREKRLKEENERLRERLRRERNR